MRRPADDRPGAGVTVNLLDVPRGTHVHAACFGDRPVTLLRSRRTGIATLECVFRRPDGTDLHIDLHPYMEVTVA